MVNRDCISKRYCGSSYVTDAILGVTGMWQDSDHHCASVVLPA